MTDTVNIKFPYGKMKIDLRGIAETVDHLQAMRNRARDFKPVFQDIALYLMGVTRNNFAQQGHPDKWAPLAPATIADRIRQGYGAGPILVRSGALMNSLTRPGATNQIMEVSDSRLRFGTRDPKAIFHQQGTRNMPRRLVLAVTQQNERVMGGMIKTHIVGGA